MIRDEGPDADLPMLTGRQATRLRALTAPHLRADRHQPLDNLAHACRHAPEAQWPELVAAHFAALEQSSQGGESAEELLRGTHARLLPTDAFTPDLAGAMRYARQVADGLVFAYALDAPTSVRILTDQDVARAGREELGQAAYRNLMRVPVAHEVVTVERRARLHVLSGDSPFVASKALFLDAAVDQATGEALPREGALFAVPDRHTLAYHPIADGTVVDALNDLAAFALGAYEDGPGALSPRVYWWHRDGLTSLTVIDEDARTFSLRPPPFLLGMMKGLIRLDGAGRLATRGPDVPLDIAELTRATAESITGLTQDPAGLADAFAAAQTLAHAHCATDPEVARGDTWEAWATALQLGCALFAGAGPQECRLGEDLVRQLPALSADPPADARGWLDALYLAIVCRQWGRAAQLCRVPSETLRQDDSVDEYVLLWIDTLRAYLSNDPIDDVAKKLGATMEAAMPDKVTHAPREFSIRIDYHPVDLFHRLIARDHEKFAQVLAEVLADHGGYWGESTAPRARVALGPLAMASLAHDGGFPVDQKQPYLPMYLLNGGRIEEIPTA
ncbi:immunity 49 family protein [Streptomyces mayteni]